MAETLEQLAGHRDPVVRGLYDVFTQDMREDPQLKTEVWDVMFGSLEGKPKILRSHILSVAHMVGDFAVKGVEANFVALADTHAEVRPLPDGTKGRMTELQFDLTVNAIARRLTEHGEGAKVQAIVESLPAIKAAIVEGVVPRDLPPAA